jgi:hypothetical protein
MKKEYAPTKEASAKIASNSSIVLKAIIQFLQIFMTETLAKRLVSMVLIAAGAPNDRIVESTGLCDRSTRALRKDIANGNIDSLFVVGSTSGRGSKVKGFEKAIAEELETSNYHTRQQIADMIREKFGISLSVSAAGRLLKKRHQAVEERFDTCKGGRCGSAGIL